MRKRRTGRSWLLALLAGLLVVTACGRSERSQLSTELADREDELPSCAAEGCTEEVAVLAAALARLPGVVRLVEPRYEKVQGTSGASLSGLIIVETGRECETLRPQAAELGWKSSVSPLRSVWLQCRPEGSQSNPNGPISLFAEVRPTTREQLADWGDRGSLRAP